MLYRALNDKYTKMAKARFVLRLLVHYFSDYHYTSCVSLDSCPDTVFGRDSISDPLEELTSLPRMERISLKFPQNTLSCVMFGVSGISMPVFECKLHSIWHLISYTDIISLK